MAENTRILPVRSRPHLTLKAAQSLDGRIATANGNSRWISSTASRARAHALRASHDAVLVGIGTVLADDPALTVRLAPGPNPTRVVIDSTLRTPLSAEVLTRDGARVIIVTLETTENERAEQLRAAGAELVTVPASDGRVDLETALYELHRMNIRSVLVEGGSRIVTSVLWSRLCDECVVFISPRVVGSGIDAVGNLGTVDIAHAIRFTDVSYEVLDDDVLFRGKPVWPEI